VSKIKGMKTNQTYIESRYLSRGQRSTFNIQHTRARRRAQDLSEWQQGSNRWPTGPSGLGKSLNAHQLLIFAPHHVTFPSLNMSLDCQYRVFFTCFKVNWRQCTKNTVGSGCTVDLRLCHGYVLGVLFQKVKRRAKRHTCTERHYSIDRTMASSS
jgi:hypothetical protein